MGEKRHLPKRAKPVMPIEGLIKKRIYHETFVKTCLAGTYSARRNPQQKRPEMDFGWIFWRI